MHSEGQQTGTWSASRLGGLTGWLFERWQRRERQGPRLVLLERIALAPRQSLALVEAEGRRFLVATSAEGTPAFCPLDNFGRPTRRSEAKRSARVSW